MFQDEIDRLQSLIDLFNLPIDEMVIALKEYNILRSATDEGSG